ncbi:AI-2E family transporter [Sphingomonas morindae]|uniref:AI-2E family transporter n=1 Tax=Sphingomonas morindae TaxID=1541170 RepID=A0ABY4X5R0_9SPHN|nr:AI-2E family transporter [Sphingomonas morindae]USI72222.1 AI-2E family transporter [Sphingomonas morindae]
MNRLTPPVADHGFLRRLGLVLGALALIFFVYRVSDLVLLAFGAALGGLLLATAADALAARTPLPRGMALALAVLALFAVLGLIGTLFGTELVGQADQLKETLPRDWARLRGQLEANAMGRLLTQSLSQGSGGGGIAHAVIGTAWGAVETFANFLIILVGAIFFAAQPGLYKRGLILLAPPPYRAVAGDAIDDVARALRRWLLTQLVSMVLMGVMIGLGLAWSGVSAAAALGLLGGLSEFIPYVGPTLAMVPALVMALTGGGSVWGVLATYAVVRIVQANLITPLLSQRLVSVPPGLYLFLILGAGAVFGTYGLFFAGALAVTFYTLVVRLYVRETLGDDVPVPGSGD